MAHFAQLDENNVVINVIVVHNNELLDENGVESEAKGVSFCQTLFPNTNWVQTSYNANMRKHYAGLGFTFDANRDAFIPPKPYSSWTLNEQTCVWEAPTPMPIDSKRYLWDEPSQSWVEIQQE
jgi:hypothetical protein